eukprot:9897381-Karenia_brevis.AAC.1
MEADALIHGLRKGCNLRVLSDGGLRPGVHASSAWVIQSYSYDQQRGGFVAETWGSKAFLLPASCSSFLAEALALDSALDVVDRITKMQ